MVGMSYGCEQKIDYRLTQSQSKQLKFLLSLTFDPDNVKGRFGLDGILAAHNFLCEKEMVGYLIGGLSESIWNQRRKPEDLYKHKDVDVLVTNQTEEIGRFEQGIDWWLPRTEMILVKSDFGSFSKTYTWYENGNGVRLNFSMRENNKNSIGLHILDPSLVIAMRVSEKVSITNIVIDDDVRDKFAKKISSRLKTCLPSFIKKHNFSVVDGECSIEEFDHDTLLAIKNH